MASGGAFSGMQQAIINYVKSSIPKDKNNAVVGKISGNKVVINNKSYPYNTVVDDFFSNGDKVYCLIPDSGQTAAIVGKV